MTKQTLNDQTQISLNKNAITFLTTWNDYQKTCRDKS